MIAGNPKHVVWLDDEYGTSYEYSLSPWRRTLERMANSGSIRLHLCSSLGRLRSIVEERIGEDQTQASAVSLLILDVMLNFEECETFELLGFPDEHLISLQAGAQIAGLIRGKRYDESKRAPWLVALRSTPLLLLSANPQAPSWVKQQVGASQMNGVKVVMKNLQRRRGDVELEPAPEFEEACVELSALPGGTKK